MHVSNFMAWMNYVGVHAQMRETADHPIEHGTYNINSIEQDFSST